MQARLSTFTFIYLFVHLNSDAVRRPLFFYIYIYIYIYIELGLQITVQTNLKMVDYLDVTLNLATGSYQPYRKPNDTPLYIHTQSNHPPPIIKHIPVAVEKRIASLSSTEEIFNKAAPTYNEALKTSGYDTQIKYPESTPVPQRSRKNRARKVIWFNPPYGANVKTNVGGQFIKLITKHFPAGHKLHKIFNKNTVKVSYSCMQNMNSIIKSHNDRTIKKAESTNEPAKKSCNCREKANCPLSGNCLTPAVVYKATVTHGNQTRTYIGNTGGPFKERFRNHTKSFKHQKYENETELSKYVWDLKKKNMDHYIKWEILKKSNTYRRKSGNCNLCMEEKLAIITSKENILNRRSEVISKCRHHSPRPPDRNKDPPLRAEQPSQPSLA